MVYNILVTETNRPTLTPADAAFALFCDQAIVALTFFALMSQPAEQRLYTGYMPEAQRTTHKASKYSNGFAFAPARETAADKALAEAQRWGLAS